ncbi:hypothetical protein ACGFZL_19885 [Streptomyces sp. NPDC048182]|uniref:hypothetical protein n=1 Tax=unclassified Streptomyces TaxID=2593676 RepID=UPI0033AB55AF
MGSGAGIITVLVIVVLLALALLSYGVGRRQSPRAGWWFAALAVGLPGVLLAGWLVAVHGGSDRPDPGRVATPSYRPGTAAHDRYRQARARAAELTERGEGPGSGMADDVYRWCTAHVRPEPKDGAELARATTEGCVAGAR